MIYYNGSCKNMTDFLGRKTQIGGICFKRVHFGIIKMWLKYEIYSLVDPELNALVLDERTGKTYVGKHLNEIEIKWGWK